jgi:hypothetical protein
MTEQVERPNLSRRRVLTAAALVPAAAIPALAVATPAQAGYNGGIRREQVIDRARNWYDRNIQYSYDYRARASDSEGRHDYRRDCSGFVSMCLHSPTPGHSTRSLPDIGRQIRWRDLKPGDYINRYDDHVYLFDSWSIRTGWLWYWDLANPELDMRHDRLDANILQNQGYLPYKYNKIS